MTDSTTTQMTSEKHLSRTRFIYLAIGALALLFLGLVYAWSIFSTPLDQVFGWGRSALSVTFSLSMITFCLGGVISSFITQKASPKISLICAAVLMCAGFGLTAVTAPLGIWAIHVFYGVLCGLGCGFGYNAIISTVNRWFPDRVGFSSGTLLMGYGLGALILGSVVDILMTSVGWQATFVVLAIAALVVLGVVSLILKPPPDEVAQLFKKKTIASQGQNPAAERPSTTPKNMLTSLIFVLYLLWFITVTSAGLTLIGDSKQGALAVGVVAGIATLLVGLVSTTNGVSRILIGLFFDRFGLVRSMQAITTAALLAALLLVVAFFFTNPVIYIAGAILMGFSYGGIPVMSSSFAMERFGPRYFPTNFAIANACIIPSSLLSSFIGPVVRSLAGDAYVYGTFALLIVVGAAMLFVFSCRYKKDLGK